MRVTLARSYLAIAPAVVRGTDITVTPSRFRTTDDSSAPQSLDGKNSLDMRQQRQVETLKQRDKTVRTHEAAHLAAAGSYARGAANFSYSRGADGRLYATGGSVSIDTSPVAGDPRATLQKAETVERAALAPAEPSSQDHRVASQAATMASQARQELTQKTLQTAKKSLQTAKNKKQDIATHTTAAESDATTQDTQQKTDAVVAAVKKENQAAAATLSCEPVPRSAARLRATTLLLASQMESQRQHWVA